LEGIFGVSIGELLAPPRNETVDLVTLELRQRLSASRHVDLAVIDLFREQLDALRRLDRQMGAIVAYGEVREKVEQVRQLHVYSLMSNTRTALAGLLSELGALAGWEALDRYEVGRAWEHHELAKQAARDANSPTLLAHAVAQQAFILSELGEVHLAVAQLAEARNLVERTAPRLLRAWLAAAHGEGLATAGQRDEALRAFDVAGTLLPADAMDPALPFLFLEGVHLDRWRGHALARLGDTEAVRVLAHALERLDPTFVRAETALRVDLASALAAVGELDLARSHADRAQRAAAEIGSARQQRRMRSLSVTLAEGA
jgi:tetratricopeptide (TPR) repeat protein